MASNRLWCT
ncbi:hypothetical protein KSF78_0001674 [Schistosoma japonicum]|nr:hypothetical protein KSF78_0001674 [Schistosoma japonicum]